MRRANFADVHVGLGKDGRLVKAWDFCEDNKPDEVVFHGDTLHYNEVGENVFLTEDYDTLSRIIRKYKTKIIPGNHDWKLAEMSSHYLHQFVVRPFVDEVGYYHSHWDEFDPFMSAPRWWHMLWARMFGASKTPYVLKEQDSKAFLMYIGNIHANALMWAYHNIPSKVLIGGHTHMPMAQVLWDSGVQLWNIGDMVDSNTVLWQDDKYLCKEDLDQKVKYD